MHQDDLVREEHMCEKTLMRTQERYSGIRGTREDSSREDGLATVSGVSPGKTCREIDTEMLN